VRSDRAFHRSIYLTLALSCICLGYSEWDYLPEVSALTCGVIAAIATAYLLDRRGRYISLRQANYVGVFIFASAVLWIGFHYFQTDSLMHTLPWPAGGLPYLAPLLMLLIPAKLFRTKHNGDWWGLYCISLACVGLGMSLAEEILFMGLVLLYATVAVWSLTCFYLHRARSPSPTPQLGSSLLRLSLAGLVAVPIFFLTPRTAGVPWELFNARLESGMPLDGTPDLGRTGQLKPSREIAFEVTATDRNGQPFDTLPADLHWRGASYTEYQSPRGRWLRAIGKPILAPGDSEFWPPTARIEFPDLGPDSVRLEFRIVSRTGGPLFADPVVHRPGQRPTIAVPLGNSFGYAVQYWDGSFVMMQREIRYSNRYLQLIRVPIALPSSFTLAENDPDLLAPFLTTPPAGVVDYGQRLLARLLAEERLPVEIGQRRQALQALHPDDYAAVAEAFREHLAIGGFTYTLNLKRQDKSLDPIEDFLLNTRSGHCERFATALVLLLRSVGVPSQFVLGYRGGDSIGGGRAVIRQEDAHAWAEVLLPRSQPDGGRQWFWQTLDPTPGDTEAVTEESAGFIESGTKQTRRLFAEYVINLNPDTQRRLSSNTSGFLQEEWPLLAGTVAGVVLLVAAVRVIKLRWRSKTASAIAINPVPWFTDLVAMLEAAGLPPQSGETPREYGVRAAAWLQLHHPQWSGVPREASELLYRIRYASDPQSSSAIKTLTSMIGEMRQAMGN